MKKFRFRFSSRKNKSTGEEKTGKKESNESKEEKNETPKRGNSMLETVLIIALFSAVIIVLSVVYDFIKTLSGDFHFWALVVFWILTGALAVFAIFDSLVTIPAAHYGVRLRFGGQTQGAIEEGLQPKIPFIDRVKTAPLELMTKDIRVEFTTKDNLRLVIPGSLQWRADKDVLDANKRNVFMRVSEEAVNIGLEKDVRTKIAGVGGKYDAENFKTNIQAVSDLINSILRLDKPLHFKHKKNDPECCGLKDCTFPDGEISAEKLIEFYNAHWSKTKQMLDGEKYRLYEHSAIEERYGVDIVKYSLAQIDYTPETQAAMEEEKQADFRKKAADMIVDLAKQIKDFIPGLSEQQAMNQADAILNPGTPRQMISVEGTGILEGALALLASKNKREGGNK